MRGFAFGTYTGTGSAITVEVGFVPDYVKVYNNSDAGSLAPTMEHFKGMTAGHGLKTLKSVDSGSTGNASSAKVTSNGITLNTPTDQTTKAGFIIGADADINVSGEGGYWIAMRGA